MLRRLSIQNYAIIDSLEIDFSQQLNVITGETGAGKSILLGALGLILGNRADIGALLNREKKCIVEGYFGSDESPEIQSFLKDADLDFADELTVRREIVPSGKSRAFINDTPVTLTQLHKLSSLLVDLHQQFDTLELGEAGFQRTVLDALAGSFPLLRTHGDLYAKLKIDERKWKDLRAQKEAFSRDADYHRFQYSELEEAAFKENELEDADAELKLQSSAEGIRIALQKLSFDLEESEDPVVRAIRTNASALGAYAGVHKDLPALIERLQSAGIELADIASEASRLTDSISADPARIEHLNNRLATGYRMLKKHGVKTTGELLEIKTSLEEKLQAELNIDEAIATAEAAYAQSLQKAEASAAKLTAARKAQAAPLEKRVGAMLAQVGMPAARLKVSVEKGELAADGCDRIDFLFDANKSGQFHPLRKVASGGELSRLMLCIKSLVATSMNLPTLIFDEIDTGISGEAARQVGNIMKDLAAARQVICITHQPQIAGRGDAHYFVYKSIQGERVSTGIRLLNTDERITAIARMMSGEKPTAAAMENAREMVMN